MKMNRLLCSLSLSLVLATGQSAGQNVYKIPFASRGNVIELTVTNASQNSVAGVKVRVKDPPAWLKVNTQEQVISKLSPGSDKVVRFEFSVTKDAPVKKDETITFDIASPTGESWKKDITVSVDAPDRFALYQNYPNPFNPGTTIDYTLAHSAHVKLAVYNLLGQEVEPLVDGVEDAGYKTVSFDASRLPSGVYFYRLQAGKFVEVKKMLLAK